MSQEQSFTPLCDALARNDLDSNDISAWFSLAYSLEKKLSALQSESGARVDGVDVPHAWPKEAMDGPKSEPEALVAWLGTARRFGADEAIKIMQKRLDRLEELRNG